MIANICMHTMVQICNLSFCGCLLVLAGKNYKCYLIDINDDTAKSECLLTIFGSINRTMSY